MYNSKNTSTSEPERFLISPPELKRLASQEMALILYRHIAKQYRGDDILDDDWFSDNVYDPKHIIEVVPVISSMIEDCVWDPMAVSIGKWCSYHEQNVFYDSSLHDGVLNCIDEFVLKPNGSINFRNTAKNILMADKLNLMEKFRLACLYSLTSDVKSIWPTIKDEPRIIEYKPEINPMIHYWVCVMKGESPRFPGSDPSSFESYLTVLVEMEWMSIEYFWDRLSVDEQVTAAKMLLDLVLGNDPSFIEPLFLRLSKTQFRKVIEEIDVAYTLIYPFFETLWKCPEVFEIWNYIKYFISLFEFRQIIKVFIRHVFTWGMASFEFSSLLFKMWSSAPDHLKHSFLNDFEAVRSVFRELNTERIRMVDYYHDMRFFIIVFNELSFQSRNALWCEFWRGLIFDVFPKCLDHMMRLCWNNDHEITQFKERFMLDFDKIERFCYLSFSCGRISQLNDYLNFCSSNVHYVAAIKRQIIKSVTVQSGLAKEWHLLYKNFIELDKFIDSAFFDADDARCFKIEILRSNENLKKLWLKIDRTKLGRSWSQVL